MPIQIIYGNLLDTKYQYIAQQCNCLTVKSHGLSEQIAKKYSWADVYRLRLPIKLGGNICKKLSQDTPGTIKIMSSPDNSKHVICMFAQWVPGKVSSRWVDIYSKDYNDTEENRLKWFRECIDAIDALKINTVAMPYKIGCGLAGGDWSKYEKILDNSKTHIVLYRYD